MKRLILKSTTTHEEHFTANGSAFNHWALAIHTLLLECGHKKIYRGTRPPKVYSQCKRCDEIADELARDHFDRKRDIDAARKGGPQ